MARTREFWTTQEIETRLDVLKKDLAYWTRRTKPGGGRTLKDRLMALAERMNVIDKQAQLRTLLEQGRGSRTTSRHDAAARD